MKTLVQTSDTDGKEVEDRLEVETENSDWLQPQLHSSSPELFVNFSLLLHKSRTKVLFK